MPAATAAFAIASAGGPPTVTRCASPARAAARPHASCSASACSPSSSISPSTARRLAHRAVGRHGLERALQRPRVRVVRVVDQRDARREAPHLASPRGGPGAPRGARPSRPAARRYAPATAIAARALARCPRPSSGTSTTAVPVGRRHRCARARQSPVDHAGRRHVGRHVDAEGEDACRRSAARAPSRAGRRHWPRRATPAVAPSRISALASAMASSDAKNAECTSATIVHTRTSGSAMPDQQADLARVVHPEFDHRDLGPVAKLEQRQRQADVVVEVAVVAEHPVAGRPSSVGRDFLRRRLARAAGDGHHRARPTRDGRMRARRCRARGRVVHLHHGDGRVERRRAPARRRDTTTPGRARLRGPLRTKRVAVEALADDRDEEVAGPQRARVDREPVESPPSPGRRSGDPAMALAAMRGRSSRTAAAALTTPSAAPSRQRVTGHRPRRRTGARGRAMIWYFSCPLPAMTTTSPGPASAMARSMAARRSATRHQRGRRRRTARRRRPAGRDPRRREAELDLVDDPLGVFGPRVVRGEDHRGRSAARPRRPSAAACVRSRSPPQPNTVVSRAAASGRTASSRFFSASSVCA